jgi:hypothetical protein
MHDLRRFAASRMAELGAPETDAMELLGMETRSIFTGRRAGRRAKETRGRRATGKTRVGRRRGESGGFP